MQVYNDLSYGEHEAQKLDLYLPEQAEAMFVYFHGGGLNRGDKDGSQYFAPYLAERKIAVVTANYRMYPDAHYPDFIEDAALAVAWARQYMKEHLGCDRLYVGGSSAGGYLSMMLCFDKRYLTAARVDPSVVTGYFHDAGQPTAHFNVLKYDRGVDSKRVIIDETAPLYYVGLEKSYPPMRFIVSDQDIRGRYEQTMLMLSALSDFHYSDFDHAVMHGKHCEYWNQADENGESRLGKMILDFIRSLEK